MSDLIPVEQFAAQLNSQFRLEHPAIGPLLLELVDVKQQAGSAQYESFALTFCGPGQTLLPQATYHFLHDALGGLDLFLVPIARTQDGLHYEAVFNRLRQAGA